MDDRYEPKLTERIFEKWPVCLKRGYSIKPHILVYQSWYFSRILTYRELWVLDSLFAFITQGKKNVDPWKTNISMRKLGSIIGVDHRVFTDIVSKLATVEIKCPICDTKGKPGVIEKELLPNRRYEIDVSKYISVAAHIQSHWEDNASAYEKAKTVWLEKQKAENKKAKAMLPNIATARAVAEANRQEKQENVLPFPKLAKGMGCQ